MTRSVCKAVGYGMPIRDFYQSVRFPMGSARLRDELEEHLPNTEFIRHNTIMDKLIITGMDGLPELFLSIGEEHIMIFPTRYHKQDWCRHGDDIDQVSAKAMDPNQSGKMVYFDEPYLSCGYMDRNGVEVSPPFSGSDHALIPGIPRAMRWWLTHFGVFDLTGIAKLRPMAAEWWGEPL